MKRFICWLTIAIVSLAIFPALADNVRQSGLYTYEIKGNGTITITDFDWQANSQDIFIPNMIDGYTVTGIADEAFLCLEQNDKQFNVTLSNQITTIGKKAFMNANITAINIPDSVKMIGAGAFVGCPECQFKITPTQNYFAVIDNCLYDKTKKELIACSWLKQRRLIIPEGIKSIGAYSLSYIESSYKSTPLEDIYLPTSLVAINEYAFASSDFSNLFGELPNINIISKSAFEETFSLYAHLLFSNVTTVEERAFYNSSFNGGYNPENYAIDFTGSTISVIGDEAFFNESRFVNSSFILSTNNIVSIGKGNNILGLHFEKDTDFSPELSSIPTGLNPKVSGLPSTVLSIQSKAFTRICTDFYLPFSLDEIATDAFPEGSTFIVESGSYAELWCSENGFGYTINGQEPNLDWLNE